MKFNISSKTLQTMLSATFRVINAKSPLTILENFLFSLSGNTLTVKGSDQENNMTAELEVTEAEGEGAVAVPAKRMLDMLKEMPEQGLRIAVDSENQNMKITFAQGEFEFMCLPGDEYPEAKSRQDDALSFAMPASAMLAGLENTLYAASTDTIRPIMTGVCVDFKPESLVFVASDTHKLVKYENKAVQPGFERRFVLPAKACQLLRQLLDKEEGDLEIVMDANGATFRWGAYELSCVFVTGTYPPYERVIPKENPFVMEVDRNAFLAAARRMVLTANSGSRLVRMQINSDQVELTARDIDYARSGHETVPCNYQGNPMSLGFNGDYMVDVVANLPGDTISLSLSDPSRPGIFMPVEQPENASVLVLLMTMQLLD